jgi:hypothetical protein
MRLGWAVAEVRGRNRLGDDPTLTGAGSWQRGTSLPLAMERTAAEQRIEAEMVLASLAGDSGLKVDPPANGLIEAAPAGTASDCVVDMIVAAATELPGDAGTH